MQNFFQDYHQNVDQFGPRPGQTFCGAWSGSKLFAVKEFKILQIKQFFPLEREVIHLEYLHISEEASKNFPGIGELEEEEFYDDCGNRVPEERISFM